MRKNSPSTLLLQFRRDKSGPHEVKVLYDKYEKFGRGYSEFIIVNVADFNIDIQSDILPLINKSTSVILGGSGEFGFYNLNKPKKSSVYKDMSKLLNRSNKIIDFLLKSKKPSLGICFGIQLLGWYLGADVVTDGNRYEEIGFTEIMFTDIGKKDTLFRGIRGKLYSSVGHHSSVINFNNRVQHLAFSQKIRNEAVKVSNFYGLQFHPELSYNEHFERGSLYKNNPYKNNKDLSWYRNRINAKLVLFNFWRWSEDL